MRKRRQLAPGRAQLRQLHPRVQPAFDGQRRRGERRIQRRVLRVTLPKKEEVKARQIQVTVTDAKSAKAAEAK